MNSRSTLTINAPSGSRPAPDPALSADDVLRAAEDLVPLLRERAVRTDESRRIKDDTYHRLQDVGFFHILKPRKYVGLELSEHEQATVTMTLARGCPSTAWVVSILGSHNMAILAFPAQVHEEVWGTNTYATLADNTNLTPKAKAVRVPGGYRLTGSWGSAAAPTSPTSPTGCSSTHPRARTARVTCSSCRNRTRRGSTTGSRRACAERGAGRWRS
jgi:hypothetical protein